LLALIGWWLIDNWLIKWNDYEMMYS
jgi:hypothetical protein